MPQVSNRFMAHPSDQGGPAGLGSRGPGAPPAGGRGGPETERSSGDPQGSRLADAQFADPVIGRIIGNNFRVLKLIGTGAMGHVYQAEQLSLGKMVALKLLRSELMGDEKLIKRFELEAKNASQLNHPNSIQIIDFGRDRDLLYIAMELLPGVDLGQLILREGPLPLGRIARIMDQVCAALDEAHAQGIVHRDLKPGNIMLVSRRGDPDFVKVCDFGIAKAQTSREGAGLTMKGLVCGTPEYMSPEQARGEEVDGRSDLYAVGVILYQLVTGELPFTASSPVGILSKHLAESPMRPTMRRPGLSLPPLFERAILRALAKDPDERPQTAEEMRRELRAAAAGMSDWTTVAGQAPVAGSSSRDLPAQPTTPIHIAHLNRPEPDSRVGTARERPVAVGNQPRSSGGRNPPLTGGGISADVPSTVVAPRTVSTRWPRQLGGLALGLLIAGAAATWLWFERPFGLAGILPGQPEPAAVSLPAPQPSRPELTASPPPPAPAPGAGSAVATAAPPAGDEVPAVHDPVAALPAAEVPAAATSDRPAEADHTRRANKRTRRAAAPAPVPGAPAPAAPDLPAARAEAPVAAAIEPPASGSAGPVREHRSAAPTTASDPMKEAERLLSQGEVANACKKGEEQKAMTPRLPGIYKFLGKCYMRAGQPDRAKDAYRRYLELAPDAADAAFIKSILR
jgi:serine/threonine protein kinase